MLTREQQKAKALQRLEQVGLKIKDLDTYEVFEKNDVVYYSEHTPMGGILYTLPDNIQHKVDLFEQKYGYLVYHVIHTPTKIGSMWSFLYVGSDEEDIAYEDECFESDLMGIEVGECDNLQLMAYVYNETFVDSSEFGYICVKEVNGGLIRIA